MGTNFVKISNDLLELKLSQSNSDEFKNKGVAAYSLKQTYINSRECPHCGSHNVIGKGNYRGRKRYKCRSCGRSYNDLTKTPFSGIHDQDKLKKYLNCLLKGVSIRKAAETVHVSVHTSFLWRHRLLDGFNRLPTPKMKNVREILEMELPYSHKGQRSKLTDSLKKSKVSAVFVCDRLGKLDSNSVSLTERDSNLIFSRLYEMNDNHVEYLGSPKFVNISKLPIKNSSSPYSQPKLISKTVKTWMQWMKRFHGVATKYLNNYLHWFDFLDNIMFRQENTSDLVRLLLAHS